LGIILSRLFYLTLLDLSAAALIPGPHWGRDCALSLILAASVPPGLRVGCNEVDRRGYCDLCFNWLFCQQLNLSWHSTSWWTFGGRFS